MLFAVVAGVICARRRPARLHAPIGRCAPWTLSRRACRSWARCRPRTLEEIELQQPLFERTLRPLAGRLSGIGQRFASPSKVGRTEKRLVNGRQPGRPAHGRLPGPEGRRWPASARRRRLRSSWRARLGNLGFGFLAGIGFGAAGLRAARVLAEPAHPIARSAILLAVPDTLDLLTISVRAGLGFDGALAKVVEKTHGPLADEFRRALAEIRVGKARRDALRDIVGRTEVPALTNFIGAIIQAEQLGVPIARCSRSSPSSCASSAASAPRSWRPRRRSRCSSRSWAASSRRCSSSSLGRRSS